MHLLKDVLLMANVTSLALFRHATLGTLLSRGPTLLLWCFRSATTWLWLSRDIGCCTQIFLINWLLLRMNSSEGLNHSVEGPKRVVVALVYPLFIRRHIYLCQEIYRLFLSFVAVPRPIKGSWGCNSHCLPLHIQVISRYPLPPWKNRSMQLKKVTNNY